ncbi:sugar kinase [Streptomyces sp. NPDC001795]|uniref:sugar kinase n=1 Tax=unclassified Streptomyces TaxID=2593676 RepID=UPI00333090DE
MIRRRALTLLIIVLLIGVPAGYLIISADQSRSSGRDKEAKYSATGLLPGWPSRVQRRLYQVWIPMDATGVAYYETNNWKTSRLYVEFNTSTDGLNRFLSTLKATQGALNKDDFAIGARDQGVVGWTFTGRGSWYGMVHEQKNPAPTLDIVVNKFRPNHATIYVVSRTVP